MRKWMLRGLALAAVLVLAGLAGGYAALRASLAQLDGDERVPGLSANVTIERDALGVPTVRAHDRLDLARATGFLHAQDRFVQMDFIRRTAAGEVAELVGPSALPGDRAARLHRLRAIAHERVRRGTPDEAALIQAYTDGVNAGLAALRARPFEYLLLGLEPRPWTPEDTLLVVFMMWIQLTDELAERDAMLDVMRASLPGPVFDFATQSGTRWDAPLLGGRLQEVPLPGPEIYDLRTQAPAPPAAAHADDLASALGSNSWAVAAANSADGRAWVANDMHMSLLVPNNWYRMRLVIEGQLDATGVMLPGTPVLSVGSNGHVAWSFTNLFGDFSDRVAIDPDPADADKYLAPGGSRAFEIVRETIAVRGAPAEVVEVRHSIWGPVVGKGIDGREQAVWWLAAQPGALNLRLGWLEQARSVDEALAVARGTGIPPQNFVVADSAGRIGWTIVGVLPRRPAGVDSATVRSWAQQPGVEGFLDASDYPAIVDPPEGRLWTANARAVEGEALARLGDGGYDVGARAGRIRDALRKFERAGAADHLGLQLDTQSALLAPWQPYLVRALEALAGRERRYVAALEAVRQWGGAAQPRSVGYRLVREFHDLMRDRMFDALCAPCRARAPQFKRVYLKQWDEAALRILENDAIHLLPPLHASVQALLEAAPREIVDPIPELSAHTWGARTTLRMKHGIGRLLPQVAPLLDMPSDPLPGDADVVRVQGPEFGASERFAVSPGNEAQGYFHMPGGQSGHPLSPFYRAGHEAWVKGEPTPFLPGAAKHRIELIP